MNYGLVLYPRVWQIYVVSKFIRSILSFFAVSMNGL